MLLAIVLGLVLVLVGVTASALVAVASAHLTSATLSGVAARDASLVELFVNDHLRGSDLDADGPSAGGPGRAVWSPGPVDRGGRDSPDRAPRSRRARRCSERARDDRIVL